MFEQGVDPCLNLGLAGASDQTLQQLAPFDQGEALGELKVTLSDGKEILVPLVALNGVQEAGFFAALWDTIMLFFLKLTGGDPLAL